MAEQEKSEQAQANPAEDKPKSNRGPLKLLLGIVIVVAAGGGIALMAIPKKDPPIPTLEGPWSLTFFDDVFVANTLDDNFSRYIRFSPSCSYFAYDPLYAPGRLADPDLLPALNESISNVVAKFRLNEIMVDGSGEEMALTAQLEQVIEPLLFPVHVGETVLPLEVDPESGLRVGDSQERRGTFRGRFQENFITVDGPAKTLQLGDGDAVTYTGSETDLELRASDGRTVFVDVTKVLPEFQGKVKVGVRGRIRQIYLGNKLAQ